MKKFGNIAKFIVLSIENDTKKYESITLMVRREGRTTKTKLI
jgi:hypothetical protein